MLIRNHKSLARWIVFALAIQCSLFAIAQESSLQFIEQKLVDYRNKTLQEKLYVHTDKAAYLAGEFLWFKVYYVEGYTHQPLHLSSLAYVEILDAGNKAVVQAKVSLKPGADNGSLYLPLNLPTGTYKFRAYTAWMKNFSPDFYFEKAVTIINPLSNRKEAGNGETKSENTIEFFPEGGYLVNGLSSILAFKGSDPYGRGLQFKGWIVDGQSDTILSFSPFKFGMGKAEFTPVAGHHYTAAVVFADGKRVKAELPTALERGYVLNLRNDNPAQLKIEVKTSSGSNGDPVFLLAQTRQVIRVAEQGMLNNGTAVFTIDASRLTAGITQFTLFDAARRPVAERLFFTSPTNNLKAEVTTDKKSYESREKIGLSLRTMDNKGAQVPAIFSLSVFRLDSVQVPDQMNIANYLLLTSDLAGKVESPDFYFTASAESRQAADNLMLTQGWRRFRWQTVLTSGANFAASFAPEVNGPSVQAKLFNKSTGQPAAGLQTFLSLPGKQYQVYFTQSDSLGNLQFELKDYFGTGEMMIKPFTADDSLYRVELKNPFSEQYNRQPVAPLSLSNSVRRLLENYSIGMQVRQVYAGDSLNHFTAPQRADTIPFLGAADYSYNLDDYTRFTTMEEVLREYVRPINVGVRNGKSHLVFVNEAQREGVDNNLLVLLDGVPLSDADRIFAYDPLKVKKLEIFPRPYVLGSGYAFGVANFATYKDAFDGFEIDPHLIALNYEGLQMQREFYVPTYETPAQKESRLPDYRNTLYWKADIQTKTIESTRLSFYSCDQKGEYLGLLQGMDEKGTPIITEFRFEVK